MLLAVMEDDTPNRPRRPEGGRVGRGVRTRPCGRYTAAERVCLAACVDLL